jgi:ribosomal protein L7Ae-like RNA K-turn-binding protein
VAAVRADAALVAGIRRVLSALRRGKAQLSTIEELFAE